jgi:amino acid adenylation domain-containing protein
VAYNMPIAIEISGPLDIAALEAAVNEVIRHQEALRATFSIEDEEPVQWIAPELRIPMPLTDIGSAPNGPERLERIMHDESRQSFDLAEGPLISTRLVRVSGGRHVLLATAHHLIVDAWSAAIILRQTAEYYRSFTAGEPQPGGSRSSYSAVVLRQLTSAAERDASQLAYWKRQLQDIEPWRPGALRHMQPSRRVTRSSFELPRPLQNSLEALARREGTTLFTVLLAAFELLVARYSGRDEVCIGTPVTTRIDQESRELVGCFVNTLAIRARMTTSMSFSELVHRTKQTVLAAIEHQDVTWERVVEHINPPRERGRLPFFQALFVLHSFSTKSLELPDLVIRSKLLGTGVSPFELMMIVDSSDGDCAIEYSDAFDSHIASMTHSFITMLEEVVRRPDSLIADLPRPDGHMTVHAVGDSNAPAAEVPCERCLHELFEEQVRRLPDAVAVRSPNDTLSYSQLNVSADALASILRDQRVERGTLVGIALERSPQAIVSMLAVLKAGGAFVPIDPHWPADRVRLILEDTRAVALVTEERFITCRGDCPTIVLDRLESSSRPRHDAGELRAETVPQDLAYVLYTSGSTGRPKGVLIDHAAICHQIAWRQAAFPLGAEDAVLHTTSLTFDPSVWEIFGPLSAGSTVVIAPGAVYDGAAVNHLIRRHGITTLQVVPSVLRSWLARDAFEGCRSLQRVFCGGEPLDATLRTNVFRQVHAELINLYGCTETAIDASWHRCDAHEIGAMTPIGRPIAHTRLYVLDENLRPAPDGLPGELCVAGPGIARGYLNDPELSGQRFIADPVTPSSGLRAFLTGDVVRRLPGGDLEFVERRDRQLKVRGCRIEATEVELALRRHPAVQEAAVGVGCDANGDSLLVAWLVHSGDRPSHAEMRMFLAELLPGFMLPDRYAWVKALPRLASGKSDVRTLADGYEPDGSVRAHTETERALVRLWEDMLGTPGIGINDNFFDLGGHSLLAVRLAARMSKLLGRAVRCGDVMELGTIAAIAASRPADNDAASETLEPREAQKQPM